MKYHDCFKVSSSMFCVCFQGCLNNSTGVSCMFQGCFKSKCVLKKLQGYFKSASKVLERKFQNCSKKVSRLFHGDLKNVSKSVSKLF